MTSSINGAQPPPRIIPEQPPEVIHVNSREAFTLVREVLNVIHHAQSHYHSMPDRHYRPMTVSPLINPNGSEIDGEESDYAMPSANIVAPPEESTSTNQIRPENPMHEAESKAPMQDAVTDNNKNYFVPDLTDHTTRPEDKLKYQKMMSEMLDRVARLIKEMAIASSNLKMDLAKELIPDAGAKLQLAKVQQALTDKIQGKDAAALHKKAPVPLKEGLAVPKEPAVKKQDGPIADANLQPCIKRDPHQVELVIEQTGENGETERIEIERGEIEELIDNLKEVMDDGFFNPENKTDSIERLNRNVISSSEETFDMAKDLSSQPMSAILPPVSEESEIHLNAPTAGHLTSSNVQEKQVLQNSSIHGNLNASRTQSLAQIASMGAAVSYMPGLQNSPGISNKLEGEESFRVEAIEPQEGKTRSSEKNETKDSKQIEAALALKASRKDDKTREIEEVVKNATDKEIGVRKGPASYKGEDGKVTTVSGKFTVEQLRNIRKKKGKAESGTKQSKAETFRLIDILYMMLCAAVCGSQTIFDITAFIESREKWFNTVLGIKNVPTSRLISRLITSFNANSLSEMLNVWMKEAQGAPARSGLVSIMVTETYEGLIFSQEKLGVASTAELCMPQILQFIDMRGVVVALSSGSASKKILSSLQRQRAQFIYELEGDFLSYEEELLPLFERALEDLKSVPGMEYKESYVEGVENLQYLGYPLNANESGASIASISQVVSEVISTDTKEEFVQYFISSVPDQSVWLFELLRTQRAFEGKTHWMMNLSMRGKYGGEANFAAREFVAFLRRHAVNLLLKDFTFKGPVHLKQQRAIQDPNYLMKIIKL